jgi:chromosome segregation ATPase
MSSRSNAREASVSILPIVAMMKFAALALFASLALPVAQASNTDPIEKVIEMISDLQAKVLGEGKDAQQIYDEFAEFCEDRSRELGFEIKTGKGEVQSLEATIAKDSATIDSLNAKIEELSAALAVDEADLKAATTIRDKELAVFKAEEAKLGDIIDTLGRAIRILETEMAKTGGTAMVQLKGV